MNNGSLLETEKKNFLKNFLGINGDGELPDRVWDLVDFKKFAKAKKSAIEKMIGQDGVCKGLAVLWSFGKKLEDQGLNGDEFDNIAFMRKTANILVNWNGYAELEEKDTKDIERFISNISTYQSPIGVLLGKNEENLNLVKGTTHETQGLYKQGLMLFETTKKLLDGTYQRVNKYFHGTVATDISGLENRLEDIMKQSGKMVTIGICGKISGHALSAYKAKDGTMYFYDPNDGEKEVDSIEHLAKEIQSASESLYPESKIGLIDFKVRVYDYTDDEELTVLDDKKFLTTTEDALKNFMKSADLSTTEDRYMFYRYLSQNQDKVAKLIINKDSDTLNFMKRSEISDLIKLEEIDSQFLSTDSQSLLIRNLLMTLYLKSESISKLLKAGTSSKDIGYVLNADETFFSLVFENIDAVASFVQNGNSLQQIKAKYDEFIPNGYFKLTKEEKKYKQAEIIEQIAEAFEKISTEETTKGALFNLYKMALEKIKATEEVDENNNMLDQT